MPTPFFLTRFLARSGLAAWLPRLRRRLGNSAACLRYASDRTLALPLEELRQFAEFWQPAGPDVIDLTASAPQFDRAMSPARITGGERDYPPLDGLVPLREAVAERLSDQGRTYDPADEITITAGASGAFHRAIDTFINPGDSVVLLDPCSPLFHLSLRQRRAKVRWLPTSVESGRTRIAPDAIRKTLAGAKMLVFANPGNPNGGAITGSELESLIWWCANYDVLIFCDESFAGFADTVDLSPWPIAQKARPRTLLAGSFARLGGAAGARAGWLAGNRDLLNLCRAQSALNTPFVATSSQQWALGVMRNDDEFGRMRRALAARRQYAMEQLKKLGLAPVEPAGGFYFWIPVQQPGSTGRQWADQLLNDVRVAVMPGDVFGPSGQNFVRLSVATDDGRLREAFKRLSQHLGQTSPTNLKPDSQHVAVAA